LNGAKYRQKLSADDRREYQRMKQAEYLSRKKGKPLPGEATAIRLMENGEDGAASRVQTSSLPEDCQ
jgi:hypothetical protein